MIKHLRYLVVALMVVLTPLCLVAKKRGHVSSVSSTTEIFVKSIQQELSMESYKVKVKNLNEENAMVVSIPLSGRYTLFLNEKWFNTFSEEAKRFIIGHELMHIKHMHISKTILLSFLWPTVDTFFLLSLRKKLWFSSFPKKLCLLRYSRSLEKNADISCAKKLHCVYGGIEFFEALEKKDGMEMSSFLSSHPLHRTRIDYLKELAESKDYQKR